METNHTSEKTIAARSTIYGAVSSLFSDPDCEKFSMLLTPIIQGGVLDACFQLDEDESLKKTKLSNSFQKLLIKLDKSNMERISGEFIGVFGHTLSKQTAPYALEHLKNSDVFFRTQKLADLNAFYRAFAMEVESIERADHIATQAEFLSFILLKELLAIEKGLKGEKEVCEKAIFDFQKDHFLEWTKIFSENLSTYVDGDFYPEAGRFLNEFLKKEKS